jgi:hypothetical protein
MADDKKISDLDEALTSGDLHDDMNIELYDPLEAALVDQNKRVRLETLLDFFGNPDVILSGSTEVRCTASTITAKVSGTKQLGLDSSGMSLAAGATVNDIEVALTNSATKIPTSSAVFAAIAGISTNKIEQADSKVEVIDTGTGSINNIVDGSNVLALTSGLQTFGIWGQTAIRITQSGSNIIFLSSMSQVLYLTPTYQELGKSGPGTSKVKADQSTGEVELWANFLQKVVVSADGLELKGDQTGSQAIANAASSVSVTFGTAHADASYQVLCTIENTIDGSPLVLGWAVTAKSPAGFTITLSAAANSANYVLNWLIVRS